MPTVPLAVARAHLSKLVEEAVRTHQRVEITRNGQRAAILMSADDFDAMEETLEILANADLMGAIATAQEEIRRGEYFTQDEVEASMRAAGRWPR